MTPLAYFEEVDEVEGFDASVGRTLRSGLHPVAPIADTGAGTLVGGPERFALGAADRAVVLTARDVTVLRFLAEGWTTLEIAHELAYAESTIKKEVHLIVHHMGARNRTHAVALAVRSAVI